MADIFQQVTQKIVESAQQTLETTAVLVKQVAEKAKEASLDSSSVSSSSDQYQKASEKLQAAARLAASGIEKGKEAVQKFFRSDVDVNSAQEVQDRQPIKEVILAAQAALGSDPISADYEKAVALYRQALQKYEGHGSYRLILQIALRQELGKLYVDWGKIAEAQVELAKAAQLLKELDPPAQGLGVKQALEGNQENSLHYLGNYLALHERRARESEERRYHSSWMHRAGRYLTDAVFSPIAGHVPPPSNPTFQKLKQGSPLASAHAYGTKFIEDAAIGLFLLPETAAVGVLGGLWQGAQALLGTQIIHGGGHKIATLLAEEDRSDRSDWEKNAHRLAQIGEFGVQLGLSYTSQRLAAIRYIPGVGPLATRLIGFFAGGVALAGASSLNQTSEDLRMGRSVRDRTFHERVWQYLPMGLALSLLSFFRPAQASQPNNFSTGRGSSGSGTAPASGSASATPQALTAAAGSAGALAVTGSGVLATVAQAPRQGWGLLQYFPWLQTFAIAGVDGTQPPGSGGPPPAPLVDAGSSAPGQTPEVAGDALALSPAVAAAAKVEFSTLQFEKNRRGVLVTLGQGGTATVYKLNDGRVAKVFLTRDPSLSDAERAKKIHELAKSGSEDSGVGDPNQVVANIEGVMEEDIRNRLYLQELKMNYDPGHGQSLRPVVQPITLITDNGRIVGYSYNFVEGDKINNLVGEGLLSKKDAQEVYRQGRGILNVVHANGVYHGDLLDNALARIDEDGGDIEVNLIDWSYEQGAPSETITAKQRTDLAAMRQLTGNDYKSFGVDNDEGVIGIIKDNKKIILDLEKSNSPEDQKLKWSSVQLIASAINHSDYKASLASLKALTKILPCLDLKNYRDDVEFLVSELRALIASLNSEGTSYMKDEVRAELAQLAQELIGRLSGE